MTTRMLKHLLGLCLIAVFIGFSGVARAAEGRGDFPVASFVKEVIAAYGGEEPLARIKTIYTKGTIEALMRGDKGTSTRWYKRPRKLRAELVYQKSSELRLLNGYRGWRGSSIQTLREVHGPPYQAMAYQVKHLDLPFGFLDQGYKITWLGRETLRTVPVEVLQLEDNEGTVMRVYVDAATRLIVKVAGSFGKGLGGAELSAEFADFREVDGIKFPFRIANYSGGTKIAETVVTEIVINREMPDSLFQP